jgi:ribose 5-phosphate isomerase B
MSDPEGQMKIAIGSDHAGFRYKETIKKYLEEAGHEVRDFGTFSDDPVDYPVFIRPVAEAVSKGEFDRGIVLGGSGNGEAITANRIKGIRCALCWNRESALLARKHGDANMLSLGERMISKEEAMEIVKAWLETPFEGGRHISRIKQIDEGMPNENIDLKGVDNFGPDVKGAGAVKETLKKRKADDFNVVISFGYILYSEGKNTLEFKIDPGLKDASVIHIPGPETWTDKMPPWARDRRDEIIARIEAKCKHLVYRLQEY